MNPAASTIELNIPANAAPGSVLSGSVSWKLPTSPRELSINLLWFTDNDKNLRDVEVIHKESLSHPTAFGQHSFSWVLPEGPPSLQGRHFSLHWAVEVIADKTVHRSGFVLSPSGQPITLEPVPEPEKSGVMGWLQRHGVTLQPNH